MKPIAILHCPTSVLIIDDNINFLKSTIAMLSDIDMCLIPYDRPNSAANFIENIYTKNQINIKDYIYNYDNNCIFAGYKLIYSKLRFSTISSIFTDYEMPGINGIDFLKRIKQNDIFKIMLTGIATDALADKALEDNLIHYFIKKNNFSTPKLYINWLTINMLCYTITLYRYTKI